ncbi:hypothetical protein NDK43_26195 [Neobacillus pocheonensis]|uniref:SbsA Ig-like domain-containing protein n=1 Tax=Neobacillus pocheonensis TaxID=363869 RepID=A0ABT0WGR2_9BACI|nr:hypothetical protein [Neobacillus pocheonensis]
MATTLGEALKEKKLSYQVMNSQNNDVPIYPNIPINKVWEFDFDKTLRDTTVNANTVKVLDQNNKEVPIVINLLNANKKLSISPPKGDYGKDVTYHLMVSKDIKYSDGSNITNPQDFEFITQRDEVEKGTLRKGIVFVKQSQILGIKDDTITLDKSVKKDLRKGDILIIPTKKNPQGKAIKVDKVQQNDQSYTATAIQPHFAELFRILISIKHTK